MWNAAHSEKLCGARMQYQWIRTLTVGCVVGAAMLTSGCAYLTNYTRSIDLGNNSYALDVKQRVVFSQTRDALNIKGDAIKKHVICAEPSPDALTVISASAGVSAANAISAGATRSTGRGDESANSEAGQNVNVSAALAEQGAFVGLRTQSIQLLRDTMYRLCEGYAAGAISDDEFTAMQRRYQSTMMGLLAIEQLTRPVVAAQVVLASTANAQAGASSGDSAVDKAQTRVDEKTAADVQARVNLETAQASEKASRKALDDNQEKSRAARSTAVKETEGDAAAKKAAGDAAAKPYDDARTELENQHAANQARTREASILASSASTVKASAERDLQAAKAKATAAASGGGQIGAIREASAQMTADLTNGVKDIVIEINKSYMRDSCFTLLSSIATRAERVAFAGGVPSNTNPATEACVAIVKNEEERQKAEMEYEKQRAQFQLDARQKELEQRLEQDKRAYEFELQRRKAEADFEATKKQAAPKK